MGGVFDEPDGSPKLGELPGRPAQQPMEVDPSRYFETGTLQVVEGGPGGLPQIVGDAPPGRDDGLTYTNLICTGSPNREACQHYGALLLPADGVARGFGEMKQIRRFCKRLSTASELFEITTSVYGCTLRTPADNSKDVIRDFEQLQREQENELAQKHETVEL